MESAIEYLDFEVRIATDETRQSPGLLTGTLLAYGDTGDRRERFDAGALHWPARGIVVNGMHERKNSIVLIQPSLLTTRYVSPHNCQIRPLPAMLPKTSVRAYGLEHQSNFAQNVKTAKVELG